MNNKEKMSCDNCGDNVRMVELLEIIDYDFAQESFIEDVLGDEIKIGKVFIDNGDREEGIGYLYYEGYIDAENYVGCPSCKEEE